MIKKILMGLLLWLPTTALHADDWMRQLPDDGLVAMVSVPGAHDAATGSGWSGLSLLFGNQYAKTQDLTLAQMWSSGVRAFDLRPCLYDGYMNLNHGIMPTALHLSPALSPAGA